MLHSIFAKKILLAKHVHLPRALAIFLLSSAFHHHGTALRRGHTRTYPWSHLCVKPPRMSNVRQIWEVPRNCNVLSRSATYYAALTRVSSLPPRRRHGRDRADFTWLRASRRPREGPVTTTYCHVEAV